MKLGIILAVAIGLITSAYLSAKNKSTQTVNLSRLRLQMSVSELKQTFGSPYSRQRNTLTYILEDSSQLYITLRDDVVSSAIVKFHNPIRIEDPQMRKLTLVQMSASDLHHEKPSWFFAGKPAEGLIYKITQNGYIESITWVPSFSYGNNQAKKLQALLRDFKNQQHL